MHRIFNFLRPVIRLVVRRPFYILIFALILSAYLGYKATYLEIETDYINLIPPDYPSVIALEKVRATVGGEGSDVAVGIISPSFEKAKAFAEDLMPLALQLKRNPESEPYLGSVEYKRETAFLSKNALYFATDQELNRLEEYLEDKIEESILEINPFFVSIELDDEESISESDDLDEFNDLYDWLVGNEYPVHSDGSSMTLRFFPTGSQSNIRHINALYRDMEALILDLDPKSYHPDIEIVLAGRLLHRSIQIQAIRDDVSKTFGFGASMVMLLVIIYFLYKSYYASSGGKFSLKLFLKESLRLPLLLTIIAVPLLMSLTWTFGIAAILIGNLNLMTSTLALLLFGLGVDFGVHFYGRYTEERAAGHSVSDAAEITFTSTGQAIVVGAVTTAVSMFVLMFADFRGFSEFGFIAGCGILFAVIAMLIVMPAIISLLEHFSLLKLRSESAPQRYGESPNKRFPFPRIVLIASVGAIIAAFIFLPKVSFEYDFNKLDPRYPEFETKKAIVDGYSSGRRGSNPAYIIADSAQEAEEIAYRVRQMINEKSDNSTVKEVRTLQDRFPLDAIGVERRLQRIHDIRRLLDSEYLKSEESDEMQRLRKASQSRTQIEIDQIPGYLRDMFTTRDGKIGTFVMIYPVSTLSDGRNSMAFASEIGKIDLDDNRTFYAGSTSIIAAEMLRLMLFESPFMILSVLVLVAIILWLNFGSFKWMLLAILPLIVGLLWMLLIMEIIGPKLNFFNMVVLPAMLGIGIDDGVHLVHRYRENGKGSIIGVLRSTGEHCTIGSLTTMIGFMGLLVSFHPGLVSIGQLALIAVVTILFSSLIFLPALIQWLEDRNS